ncbi:hypothetical protein EC973_009671 [Apophysomyces ossiformis]|uniref:Uncharacterized protein n=1 Tax=Apophysomyces ossiformis TaxID=679940 RepID=A0A8H7ENZ0_9FUNG|nr:hypothetical protein EC973_009671 [Apophysomyces ossiformis]
MATTKGQLIECKSTASTEVSSPNGRGKSYCLIHRRYFETSWCPECGRASGR